MKDWPIERRWTIYIGADRQFDGITGDIAGQRACCLLGAAGLGKTFELNRLEELERCQGYEVRHVHLAEAATSADGLRLALNELSEGATDYSSLYLDALDEAMVPVPWAGRILAEWIRRKLQSSRPRLRLSCRSAIWPSIVHSAIADVYGEDIATRAFLQVLSISDVVEILDSFGLDGTEFSRQVTRANAGVLAQQPLTLQMLIRLFQQRRSLPSNRSELYSQAVSLLSSEREERRVHSTAVQVSPSIILEAAERLACFALLSGRETVDLSDEPSPSALGLLEIVTLPANDCPLDDRLLRAIGQSGLCDGNGSNQFRFMHRQIAEYLAGRRIARLLPHQSKSLLCSNLGWRDGVAGPLRELAAFAAIENEALARWVSESDPEILGLSDVAHNDLRRQATLQLLEQFRRRKLTDTHVLRDSLPLAGLQYPGAASDLKAVLHERWDGCDDVLEFAIDLTKSWGLTSLHGDLADLVLDEDAPFHPRVSAGYVIARFGDRTAKVRLRSLIAGSDNDPDEELKGLAIQSCWPEDLTTPELLAVLHPLRDDALHGAYFGLMVQLDRQGFSAKGDRVGGLQWAASVVVPGRSADITVRLIQRIAHGALDEVDNPAVAACLAELLLKASSLHAESPLRPLDEAGISSSRDKSVAPLVGRLKSRRILLKQLILSAREQTEAWWTAFHTPGLLALEDFGWMLACACDPGLSQKTRETYADFARLLPMQESFAAVESWLEYRDREPVRSKLNYPLSVELGSEQALELKHQYDMAMGGIEEESNEPITVSPGERVAQILDLAEGKDPKFFFRLCDELTLDVDSKCYGFERFLVRTPGWKAADIHTRKRIVESAKRLLMASTDDAETSKDKPLHSILRGYMEAAWLLLDVEPSWLENRPPTWWSRWTWYFLRELRPHFHGESEEPKIRLFKLLSEQSSESVQHSIIELFTSSDSDKQNLVIDLLDLAEPLEDHSLDELLVELVRAGDVGKGQTWYLIRFLISRNYKQGMAVCRDLLDTATPNPNREVIDDIVCALLHERTAGSWKLALSYLVAYPDSAKRILAAYCHKEPHGDRKSWGEQLGVSPTQIGELFAILLRCYPPESDIKHTGGFCDSDEDSAVFMRDQLISWLGQQNSKEALEALRRLEQQFGRQYPWLRRPRSAVERALRHATWNPIPPASVASLLLADSKRLIRSAADAAEGVVAAIEAYEWRLRHDSPSPLEDLWNTPHGDPPTAKLEERISDKLCEAIRDYFRIHAITADREVQIFRRTIPVSEGGAAGSEVDVLVTVPAVAASSNDPISIPIEVKRSMNREAKTGLREQLIDRYMSQLGSSHGVFVVVWLDAPSMLPSNKPVWKTIAEAKDNLLQQIREVEKEFQKVIHVDAIVIDASLK